MKSEVLKVWNLTACAPAAAAARADRTRGLLMQAVRVGKQLDLVLVLGVGRLSGDAFDFEECVKRHG